MATIALYALIALMLSLGVVTPPLGKDLASSLVICVAWPLIVFLLFVKQNLPYFLPSWEKAAFLGICAMSPIAYVALKG